MFGIAGLGCSVGSHDYVYKLLVKHLRRESLAVKNKKGGSGHQQAVSMEIASGPYRPPLVRGQPVEISHPVSFLFPSALPSQPSMVAAR